MTLVLDAGALVAIDRSDRRMQARVRVAETEGEPMLTNAMVVARVWRDDRGRQALLSRFLVGVNVLAVDQRLGRAAGVLLARAGMSDPIDATVVLMADDGDRILTSDPDDIRLLAEAAGRAVRIVAC